MSAFFETTRSLLAVPAVYRLWNWLARGSAEAKFVKEYVKPKPNDRVLDIGCGPGNMVPYLPSVDYVGFDASESYIKTARKKYRDRGTFICELVSKQSLEERASFDIALASGILHHLDDAEALQLFELAWTALKPGGRLISMDGCFVDDQSYFARWFISRDRGKFVRTPEEYVKIASQVFSKVEVNIRHDLLRIPYTLLILECHR